MYASLFKTKFFKSNSGATAIEYGLIGSLIAIAAISSMWTTGQETSNIFNRITNTMDDRQALLDDFYDLTATSHNCNNFGSCGSQGNQGVWEGFKDVAMSDDSFDDLMTDRDSFEVGIFAEARQRTKDKLNFTGSWARQDQTEVRQAAQEVWIELASEASSTTTP